MSAQLNEKNQNFRLVLRDEFSKRCRSNPRYSLRAFAKQLDVDSSTLSQILAGKRKLSSRLIQEFSQRAGISVPMSTGDQAFNLVALDSFAVISDWYHYAILDLTYLKTFKDDPKWVARKLSITEFEAKQALERLLRLGLLKLVNGKLVKGESFYTNYSEGVTSAALKEYQRQVIQKALEAIDTCPQDRKDITSITIPADSRKLDQAKTKIKKFRRSLCRFLESDDPDSVYHLTLQLYPVTNVEN